MSSSPSPDAVPCRCGHPQQAHDHYRRGTDCALCGSQVCPRYRTAGGLRGLWRGLGLGRQHRGRRD